MRYIPLHCASILCLGVMPLLCFSFVSGVPLLPGGFMVNAPIGTALDRRRQQALHQTIECEIASLHAKFARAEHRLRAP
jgi:hypothetical protein